MSRALKVGLIALFLIGRTSAPFPDCANGPELLRSNAVCDTSLSVIARVTAIINAMTVGEKLNNTGSTSPSVPRLGLPPYQWWQEALHGVASSPGVNFSSMGDFSYATSFPQPILMSAAFDDALIEAVATVGRGQETPGEDPFHLRSYVKSLIQGLQGGYDPAIKRAVATCKHFAAYDMETWEGNYRYQFNAKAVNGIPSCANDYLLQTILREHWGWTNEDQWVTSDCDAVQNIYLPHGYTSTREEAVADALKAGTDVNCGEYYPLFLPAALEQGLFNESTLDQALVRQYSSLVKLGYFDPVDATPYRFLAWSDVSTPASEYLAYKAAVEGITLLKNDGILPLSIHANTTIALLGDWANATSQMQGNYAGIAPFLHSPLYAAQQLGITVNYADGPGQGNPTTNAWDAPLHAAEVSDIVIYAGGIDNSIESEGNDRYSIDWTGGQIDLINQISAMGKPTILLQMGGGQLDDSPFTKNPNISAILWGGYPGQDGGTALINILIGKEAPAGRLPVTQYPADYVNEVPMTDMALRPSLNNLGRTYKWYSGTPVYEFGYGLHFTNFTTSFRSVAQDSSTVSYDISSLVSACNATYMDLCPFASLPVDVTNTGQMTSDFVTLGFISGQYGPVPYPKKQLVAYERLHRITAGSTQTAYLNFTLGSLARVDDIGNTILYPGDYAMLVDVPTQSVLNFTLIGSQVTLDAWPQPTSASNGTARRRR